MKISKITESLILASAVAVMLVLARGGSDFYYMLWNLFLAWIPYLLSSYLAEQKESLKKLWPVFVLWLVFFPNAPYLSTCIIHLLSTASSMLWYDILLFTFFAWVGLVLGILSLMQSGEYLERQYGKQMVEPAIVLMSLATSFGIYLGRFERLNSWDFFLHPAVFLKHSHAILTSFTTNPVPFIFTVLFALCLYTAYKMVYALVKKG